ncbi:hypothetical protein K438DRAFT_1992112 [Mycena galopus ATCC 62051]|nr:hypothetical protein K438DRAFT_1992112 [Mycena galopus ATCC 62051]
MAKIYFCLPCYKPDPGHENKDVHDASPRARYYAIVSGTEGVVVTSEDAMAREVKRDPNARQFSATTWTGIMELWNEDCELMHAHGQRLPIVDLVTPDSSPARPSLPVRGTSSPSKTGAKSLTTREVAATFEEFSAAPAKLKTRRTPSPSKAAASPSKATAQPPNTEEIAAQFGARYAAHEVTSEPLWLYGVTGHNRLFRSRERAMGVLKATPGADLIFAHDEASVEDFIRAEGVRMMTKSSS